MEHRNFERLRTDLKQWNEQVCNRRLHGTTRKIPLEVFEQNEREALLPLPAHRYELYQWEEHKVNRLGHITFQQNYYSVPYTLVGKTLCVKSNGLLVKLYENQQEVALHQQAEGKGTYITRPEHLPPYKQPKTEEAYRADMAQIGEQAPAFLKALLQYNRHWKEKVQGILSLRKSYSNTCIDQACGRALDFGAYSYQKHLSVTTPSATATCRGLASRFRRLHAQPDSL